MKLKSIFTRRVFVVSVLLILIGIGVFFLFKQRGRITDRVSLPIQPSPAPTDEITLSPALTPPVTFSVINTQPSDKQKYVLDNISITIEFNRSLAQQEKESIGLLIDPETEVSLEWVSNNQLSATPSELLIKNKNYSIILTFENASFYTFNFETNLYSSSDLQKQVNIQTEDDLLFGQALSEFHQDYPWYRKLPIVKDTYTITYDFEKEQFRIRLSIKPADENEQNEIINRALEDLKNIGVDTKDLKYYVL